MHISEYQNIFHNEETHFFYRSTHSLVLNLIKKFVPQTKKIDILDAGCGTGALAVLLQQFGSVEAIDLSEEAIRFAKKRGINAKKGSLMRLPFDNESFHLITCIDVLYHQQVDDVKALLEIHRVLKKNGFLIIRVPANSVLATSHDAHVQTRRRYTSAELSHKLDEAGFSVQYISGVHSILVPFVLIRKLQEKIMRTGPHTAVNSVNKYINSILSTLLLLEAKFVQVHPLPFGVGLIAVCQKKD